MGDGDRQYYLGEMAREDRNRVAAVSNIREALTAFVELGDPWTVGGCVGTLAIYLVEEVSWRKPRDCWARRLSSNRGPASSCRRRKRLFTKERPAMSKS